MLGRVKPLFSQILHTSLWVYFCLQHSFHRLKWQGNEVFCWGLQHSGRASRLFLLPWYSEELCVNSLLIILKTDRPIPKVQPPTPPPCHWPCFLCSDASWESWKGSGWSHWGPRELVGGWLMILNCFGKANMLLLCRDGNYEDIWVDTVSDVLKDLQ